MLKNIIDRLRLIKSLNKCVYFGFDSLDYIGYHYIKADTSANIPSKTTTNIFTVNLTKGKWLLIGNVGQTTGGFTGLIGANLAGATFTTNPIVDYNNGTIGVEVTGFVTISEETKPISLACWQGSTSNITVIGRMCAIKLG